jgi:hypothetical protein
MKKTVTFKTIRIQFVGIPIKEEQALRRLINQCVRDKSAHIEDIHESLITERRLDFRIVFKASKKAQITFKPTKKLPEQSVIASIKDLSARGLAIQIPNSLPVGMNSRAEAKFILFDTEFCLSGVVEGLKDSGINSKKIDD